MQNVTRGIGPKVAMAALIIVVVILSYALLRGSAGIQPSSTTTISNPAPTTSIPSTNPTTSIAVARTYLPSEEISNITAVYPNATLGTFSCNYSSDCVDVHTKPCFNNLDSQQACINKGYAEAYGISYRDFLANNIVACPQYFIMNNVSCACINNGCSLVSR